MAARPVPAVGGSVELATVPVVAAGPELAQAVEPVLVVGLPGLALVVGRQPGRALVTAVVARPGPALAVGLALVVVARPGPALVVGVQSELGPSGSALVVVVAARLGLGRFGPERGRPGRLRLGREPGARSARLVPAASTMKSAGLALVPVPVVWRPHVRAAGRQALRVPEGGGRLALGPRFVSVQVRAQVQRGAWGQVPVWPTVAAAAAGFPHSARLPARWLSGS